MLPGNRYIREELRREAAQISIPDDMWERISAQLEEERKRERQRQRRLRLVMGLKPVVAMVLAAGAFALVLAGEPAPGGGGAVARSPHLTVSALRPPKDNLRAGYFVGAAEREATPPSDQPHALRTFVVTR